jgi:hypothetical protein
LPAGSLKPIGQPPVQFEANRGQSVPAATFVAETAGYRLLLEDDAAVLVAPNDGATVRLGLTGAHRHPRLYGAAELPGKVNYLRTGDPKSWLTDIPTYSRVKYESIYDGIDLVYYGRKDLLEYDFVVAPGADPSEIALRLDGVDDVQIGSAGDLVLKTASGDLRFGAPEVYQTEADGTRRAIQGKYVLRGAREAGFEIAAFDRSKPLTIDPVLTYSTFVGSSGDSFSAMTADGSGNIYLAGRSTGGMTIQKLGPDGTTQVYRTVLGTGFSFSVQSLAVDSTGKLYLTGVAATGMPTTAGAFQKTAPNGQHAFVAVVNAAGSALTYCSYITGTGTGTDQSNAIAVDSTGKVYLTGATPSTTFPTTAGVFQTTSSSSGLTGFVAKFDPTKSGAASLVYSTYLGGSTTQTAEEGIAVDSSGNAYVVGLGGVDFPTTASAFHYTGTASASGGVYVTKLNATATAPLTYSAYLGFQNQGGTAIAVDGSGNAYVTGLAGITDFPTTAGAYQTHFPGAYVSELNSTGTSLVYSTFLSGPSEAPSSPLSAPTAIALAPGCVSACNAYVSGFTSALDFPAVNAIQSFNAGPNDTFIVELSGNGAAAVLSTYLGGSSDESNQGAFLHFPSVAVTSTGDAVVAGFTSSSDFPVTLTTTPARQNYAARITSAASAKALAIPASLTFSPQAVPVPTPTPLAVTLRNMGSAAMTISSIVPAGDFSQANTCGASLPGGADCVISVTFTPTKAEPAPALLRSPVARPIRRQWSI